MKQIIWFIHAWLARQTTSRDWPWDGPNLNRSMKRLTLMFWSSSRTISIFNATVTVLGAHCPLELRFDAARIIAGWPNSLLRMMHDPNASWGPQLLDLLKPGFLTRAHGWKGIYSLQGKARGTSTKLKRSEMIRVNICIHERKSEVIMITIICLCLT
jgi:hypothetical protein